MAPPRQAPLVAVIPLFFLKLCCLTQREELIFRIPIGRLIIIDDREQRHHEAAVFASRLRLEITTIDRLESSVCLEIDQNSSALDRLDARLKVFSGGLPALVATIGRIRNPVLVIGGRAKLSERSKSLPGRQTLQARVAERLTHRLWTS